MYHRALPLMLISLLLLSGFGNLLAPNTIPVAVVVASGGIVHNSDVYTPIVETINCDRLMEIDIEGIFSEGTPPEVECGTMTAPERHENPTGPAIRLAYVRVRSTSAMPQPDPLIIEQGGPGASSIIALVALLEIDEIQAILAERDLVAIDQRGAGFSAPNLSCPEVVEFHVNRLSTQAGYNDLARKQAVWQACYDRWTTAGVDLSAYNSLQNAADRVMGMEALGYPVFNYFGVSYGTLLGQHLMRDYPDHLRSVILDGIVPLDLNPFYLVPHTFTLALQHLFEFCASDADCNAEHPAIETTFLETFAQLNRRPVPRTMTVNGDPSVLLVTGDYMARLMFSALQSGELPLVLDIIQQFSEAQFDLAESQYFDTRADIGLALAMHASVLCAEEADLPEVRREGFYYPEVVAAVNSLFGYDLPEMCAGWPVDPLDDFTDEPVSSDIPALLLSGEYDPITPKTYAEILADTLSNSRLVTAPNQGHGTFGFDGCVTSIAAQFLLDPTVPLATGCINNTEINWGDSFGFEDF